LDSALYFFQALLCFGEFSSYCCLRHGDLLSSLLFVIVIEALSKILSVAVDGGLVPSISMGSRNVGGLHIPIANDTLLFSKANLKHLHYLCALFLCFEVVSGLNINQYKSELGPVSNAINVDGLASILGAPFKTKPIWNGVNDKIERRLAGWKMYLSKAGRISSIK
jgi:hypothetical protein